MDTRNLLITSLGTADYKPLLYQFGEKSHECKFTPTALASFRELRGWHALVLSTKDAADKNYAALTEELASLGVTCELIETPVGRNSVEHMQILDLITSHVDDNAHVMLDVTMSLRHLPFIYLAALSYLVGLKSVSIDGIFYGAVGSDNSGELIEITALFSLIEWYHAIETANQTGDIRPLARSLDKERVALFRQKLSSKEVDGAVGAMKSLSEVLASGLPVEVGLQSLRVSNALQKIETAAPSVTLHTALHKYRDQIEAWATAEGKKEDVELDERELARQLRLAQWYFNKQQYPAAVMLLREWLVSCVLLLTSSDTSGWLSHAKREPAERILGALGVERDSTNIDPQLQMLATSWGLLFRLRNKLAHAGMTTENVTISQQKLQAVIDYCNEILREPTKIEPALKRMKSSVHSASTR